MFQNLTNCKCKTFIGSVAKMKGNEARMVLFLHPVDHLKEGQVSKVKPLRNSLGVSVLLLLGLLLGLGVLLYLLLPFVVQSSQQRLESEAVVNNTTTKKESEQDKSETSTVTETPDWTPAPVTERRRNDYTEESKAQKKTSLSGTI